MAAAAKTMFAPPIIALKIEALWQGGKGTLVRSAKGGVRNRYRPAKTLCAVCDLRVETHPFV